MEVIGRPDPDGLMQHAVEVTEKDFGCAWFHGHGHGLTYCFFDQLVFKGYQSGGSNTENKCKFRFCGFGAGIAVPGHGLNVERYFIERGNGFAGCRHVDFLL